MLVNSNTKFSKDDVITLKNILGEEIVCKFVSETPTHYTINHPVALGMGQQGMQFMPPVVSADVSNGDLEFAKAHVMWAAKTQAEIESAYVQATTGLAVPPQGKIQV